MGIQLLLAAQSPQWAGLSDRAYRVLTYMCGAALDTSNDGRPCRLYTGGHDRILRTLYGRDEITDNERQMLKRAIRELREAGAITVARPASFNKFPHYRIEVNGIPESFLDEFDGPGS